MLGDWKRAWRDAVENFRRELDADDVGPEAAGDRRLAAMRRDLAAARTEVRRLDQELARVREQLEQERQEEQNCRRREGLARQIADEETARLASEFAGRHAERAAVLERKVEVLAAEQALRARDLAAMEAALRTRVAARGLELDEERDDAEFRRLEQEAKERAAAQRLEELKRRMNHS